MLTSYNQVKKIRAALIDEIEIEFPSLALNDKLTIVEMRVQSIITAGLDEKATVKDSSKRNAANQ